MQGVVVLSVFMPGVTNKPFMLSVLMLTVFRLNVIGLSVIRQNVVAPALLPTVRNPLCENSDLFNNFLQPKLIPFCSKLERLSRSS